jgi:hypothetical protein
MFAWVHLTRLCGCNYKVPVVAFGKNSLHLTDPQQSDQHYRLNRRKFLAGERQYRDSWCIERWSDRAEQRTESERNWQT